MTTSKGAARHATLIFAVCVSATVTTVNCYAQGTTFQPKGTFVKFDQPIRHVIDSDWPNDMMNWGEDIPSDFDWNKVMMPSTAPLEPNWIIADDFQDIYSLPVRTVKWWGSYVGPTFQQPAAGGPIITLPPAPGAEDGYAISFFRDIPAGPNATNPLSYSLPDGLLATYVLPLDRISIKETPFIGWDQHPIYEYEANLMDAHLDHAVTPYGDPMGFNEKAGEVYWISITAEVGHKISLVVDPTTGENRWVSEDTGKFADNHFWGWHTSPKHLLDVATMGHLAMLDNQWQYGQWMPIQPQHGLFDMAFQLKTIPEPASALLLGLAGVLIVGQVRRRR